MDEKSTSTAELSLEVNCGQTHHDCGRRIFPSPVFDGAAHEAETPELPRPIHHSHVRKITLVVDHGATDDSVSSFGRLG